MPRKRSTAAVARRERKGIAQRQGLELAEVSTAAREGTVDRFLIEQARVTGPEARLEALRTVISLASTRLPGDEEKYWEAEGEQRMQISMIDISRAYFNAHVEADEPVFVQLPPEHEGHSRG